MKRVHIFVLAVVASLSLMYFSYLPGVGLIGRVLLLFSTFFHELGHGLTAMLLGGDFLKLVVYWDGSGVATSAVSDSRVVQALVSAGGLVGPSIAAALLFSAARTGDKKLLFVTRLFAVFLVVIGLLTARSIWAVIFTLGLGLFLLFLSKKVSLKALETFVVFIGVQLGLSVFTRADYLFTRVARTAEGNSPSDVANMAQALFLPFWFWGAVCGLFSVAVLYWGCRCYIEE